MTQRKNKGSAQDRPGKASERKQPTEPQARQDASQSMQQLAKSGDRTGSSRLNDDPGSAPESGDKDP